MVAVEAMWIGGQDAGFGRGLLSPRRAGPGSRPVHPASGPQGRCRAWGLPVGARGVSVFPGGDSVRILMVLFIRDVCYFKKQYWRNTGDTPVDYCYLSLS